MFAIDYKCGLPIFEQIYRSVITLGAAGAFGESGQLPSVRAVAKELGVNPNTVQKAYSMLERDGLIHSLPGKGSFITQPQAAVDKRRQDALERVEAAAMEAMSCGVPREELTKLIARLPDQSADPMKEGNS